MGLNLPKENIKGFEPDPNASKEPIKQWQGRQQRNSTPRNPKPESTNRSSNNSLADKTQKK